MTGYKALIIDDEYIARSNLRHKLGNIPEIEIIGEAESVSEAVEKIETGNPDVIFLDIQLTDGTGFDVLNKVEYRGKVIFVTAFDSYAIRAFEINAVDYLMKPISDKRLKEAVDRINTERVPGENIRYLQFKSDDRLMVSHRNYIHFIRISDILLISAAKDYTTVRTKEYKEYLVSKAMNEWEQRLPKTLFCRIHRCHIVNFDCIRETKKLSSNVADIYLEGLDEPFRVSRSYYHLLKDRYM